MIKNIKAVILIVAVAVVASTLLGLFMLKELEKANRIKTEERLLNEEIVKNKAEGLLSALLDEVDLIQGELIERRKELASLESELAGYKRQAELSRQRIDGIEQKIASAQKEIEQLKVKIEEIKARIANIENDKLKLAGELTLLQKTTDALKEHLSRQEGEEGREEEASQPTQDLKVSTADDLRESRPQALEPSLTGEVLIVNREFDFLIISLGKRDGIEEGMVLDLSRDENILSQARVETVRNNISAAALVNKEAISRIRAGDRVLYYSRAGIQAME